MFLVPLASIYVLGYPKRQLRFCLLVLSQLSFFQTHACCIFTGANAKVSCWFSYATVRIFYLFTLEACMPYSKKLWAFCYRDLCAVLTAMSCTQAFGFLHKGASRLFQSTSSKCSAHHLQGLQEILLFFPANLKSNGLAKVIWELLLSNNKENYIFSRKRLFVFILEHAHDTFSK